MPIPAYTMYGKPVRVFPFPPNWSSPVNETFDWKTDILLARDGSEQRRALRLNPRRGFEYTMLLGGEDASMYEAYLWGWQSRWYALPVWTDIGKLTTPAVADDTTLQLDTEHLGFRAGDYALLYTDTKNYEAVKLAGVSPSGLTLDGEVVGNWPVGTRVYPIIVAHLVDSVQGSRYSARAVTPTGVIFNSSPEDTYSNLPAVAASTLYDGIEVVTARPNWGSPINNAFTRRFDTVDAEVGPVAYYETETTSRIVRPFSWFLKSRADMAAFRALIYRLRGQAKTVWMPSWHDDFEIAASNASNQSVLYIKGTWFHQMVGVDTSRDRLEIRLPNGTVVYRRITGTTPNYSTDTTMLQLDSTLGTTVTPVNNSRVRLLLRVRLASDKVVIPWRTDRVADPQTTFSTVKL